MNANSFSTRLTAVLILCSALFVPFGKISADNSPLCFTARNGSVTVRFDIKNVSHTIQYSTNGSSWLTYSSNSSVTIAANQSVYFRAAYNQSTLIPFGGGAFFGTADLASSSRFYLSSSNGGVVEGSGNIMSLYGPDCPNMVLPQFAFAYLFYNCTALKSSPNLPDNYITLECYKSMFEGCTSLTVPPELPATTLATSCYKSMFKGCTSLTVPPELPATALGYNCYESMFEGCTSLIVVPVLPATNLPGCCYKSMFKNCTSLRINTVSPGEKWKLQFSQSGTDALTDMFLGTGGTMNGTPSNYITYYIASAPTYSLIANVNDSGMGTVGGTGSYYYGDRAKLTATSNQHYHFVSWSDGDTSNPRYVTVSGDTSFMAMFEVNEYTISGYGANGKVSGTGTYEYASTAILTAIANTHYHFKNWSDGNTSNPRTVNVISNAVYTAVFELDRHVIIVNGINGTVSGGGSCEYGSVVTLTAHANAHYHFVRWSDGNTLNPRYVTVNGDSSFTAIFEINKYNVSVNDANGSVSGTGEYVYRTTATLTAIPYDYCHFVSWPDGNTSKTNSFEVVGDTVFTSIFARNQYLISATCEHGTVTGGGIYENPDVVTLTVTPDEGYRFVKWSDDNEYNPRVFVVREDLTVEAICEEAPVIDDVENVQEDTPAFFIVGNIIYNPDNEPLRVYSTEGRLIKSGNSDINMESYPKGMYIVMDERGNRMKFVISQ